MLCPLRLRALLVRCLTPHCFPLPLAVQTRVASTCRQGALFALLTYHWWGQPVAYVPPWAIKPFGRCGAYLARGCPQLNAACASRWFGLPS